MPALLKNTAVGLWHRTGNGLTVVGAIFSITLGFLLASPAALADDGHSNDSATPISVKTFGAKGDGAADDTAAIMNAIKASVASREHPCVTFPAGIYKVTESIQLSERGVCLQGTTPWNTFIDSSISGPIFNLGAFSSTQSPPWTGTANGLTVTNLTLENSTQLNVAFTGSRVTTGIQTNGSGRIVMNDVQFAGLKYGFAAPYGSDFDRFKNIWLASNDVGLYMGPSSQQFSIIAVEAHVNGESFVCDGCGQGTLSESAFVDSMTADLTFEREQPTRFGYNPSGISSYDVDSNVTVKNNWFETGAGYGGITSWQEYRRILLQQNINDTSYPRNISIENSFLVLGSAGIAPKDSKVHSFVELDSGRFIRVENVQVVGDRRDSAIYSNGGSAVTATNVVVDDGYNSAIPIFQFASNVSSSADFSYTPPLPGASATQFIPSNCFGGSQFWYDSTLNNWLGCVKGAYSYFAQLDNTLHLPNAFNTLNPSWNSATVTGDKTTMNAVQAAIYAGTSGSNNGKWWFQNAGNPVYGLNLAGYDSTGKANIVLSPSGGLGNGVSLGGVLAGFFRSTGSTFANLSTPSPGTQIWCSDCKIATPCAGGGTGAFAFRTAAGTWNCPF